MAGRKREPVPNALTDVETRELSVVDRGAVRRRFAMRKRDEGEGEDAEQQVLRNVLALPLPAAMEAAIEKLSPDAKAKLAMRSSMQVLHAYRDHLTDEHIAALHGLLGLPQAEGDAPQDDPDTTPDDTKEPPMADTQKTAPDAAKTEAPAAPAAETAAEPKAQEADAPVEKRAEGGDVDAKIEAVRKAMAKENEALRKALHTELHKRRVQESVQKARRELPAFVDPGAWGDLIVKLEDAGLWEEAQPLLKAAHAAAQSGHAMLTGTRGHTDDGQTGADGQLAVHAAAIAKRDGISEAAAMMKALEENPALYDAAKAKSLFPGQD